jgi:hypothetical protein
MKIRIVKKGAEKGKEMNVCPWIVDIGVDVSGR